MKENRTHSEQTFRGVAETTFISNSSHVVSKQRVETEEKLVWQGISEHINLGRRYSFDDNGGGYAGL